MTEPASRTDQISFDDSLPTVLAERLNGSLPGRAAQRQFAHELSYGRHFWLDARESIPAATVIVLMKHNGQWQLPLTLRPSTLKSHGGQVCLPGGRLDAGESPQQAAVREVEEELNLPRPSLKILGQLSPLYLYASNFHVTPFVAVCHESPNTIVPNSDEVAELIELPLTKLIAPETRKVHQRSSGSYPDVQFRAPHFDIDGHQVWGATAMMLSEFAAVLDPRSD